MLTDADAELLRDFTRVGQRARGSAFDVAVVVWDGPYTPTLQWRRFRRWPRAPTSAELEQAKRDVLVSKYFQTCANCELKVNAGHMFSDDRCQCCATEMGVTF